MPHPLRRSIGVLLVLTCGFGLSACRAPIDPRTFVGLTVEDVREASGNVDLILYDLSYPVFGEEASYDAGSNDALWEVVVSCRSDITDRGVPLGIIPVDDVTDDIRRTAADGGYDEWLIECPVGR